MNASYMHNNGMNNGVQNSQMMMTGANGLATYGSQHQMQNHQQVPPSGTHGAQDAYRLQHYQQQLRAAHASHLNQATAASQQNSMNGGQGANGGQIQHPHVSGYVGMGNYGRVLNYGAGNGASGPGSDIGGGLTGMGGNQQKHPSAAASPAPSQQHGGMQGVQGGMGEASNGDRNNMAMSSMDQSISNGAQGTSPASPQQNQAQYGYNGSGGNGTGPTGAMSQQVQSSQMLAHAPPTSSVPPNSIPVSSVSVSANANSVAIQQQQLLMNRVQESNKAQANLEKQRVALLLEINAELLRECIDQSKNVKAPSEGERPPDSGTTGIMKRLQANLAYLAALADRSNKGGVAPMPQIPNILSPPSDMPHLEDRYKKLQELFANMKTVNSPLHPPPHTPQQVAMQRPRAPSQSKPAMNPQVVPQSPMAAPPPQSSPPPPQQMPVTQTRQPAIHQPQMMVDPNTGMPAHPQMAGPHGMPNVNPQMMAAQNMAMHQNMMIQQQRAAQAQRQQQLQQAQAHAQRMQQQQMMAGGMAGVPGPQGVPMQGMGVQVPQGMPMGMGMQGVPGGMMPQQQPGIGQGMYMDPNQANMWNGMM